MSRYSLNLRSKYGRDEPTAGEGVARGIGTALDEVLKYKEAGREERNAMGAAGATPLPTDPSQTPMGRLRGIGSAIGGLFGRGGDAPVVPGAPPLQPTGTFAPVQPRGALPQGVGPGIVPPRLDRSTIEGMAGNAPVQPMAAGVTPSAAPMPTPATEQVRAARPSISSALESTIHPYTYEGVHGAKYEVDPLYGARVKAAAGQMQVDAKQDEQIQALVDGGMDPKEARARVLNNVVKYDDVFGQQSRGGGRMTQAEWNQRQEKMQADRVALEKLKQQGKLTPSQYQAESLRLRQEENAARAQATANNLEFRAGTAIVSANKEPSLLEKDPNEPESAPTTRARARATGTRMQQNAVTDAQRRANAGTDPATKARAASRAQALKRQGKSNDEIRTIMQSEGYNVQ